MTTTRFSRLARGKGGLVTVGTVAALLIGIAATIFGLGAVKNAIANYDAASWLWSTNKGEVARVNGVTGRADTPLTRATSPLLVLQSHDAAS